MKSKTIVKNKRVINCLSAILLVCFLLHSMMSEIKAKSISIRNVPTELSLEQEDGVVTLSWTNNGGTGNNLIERRTSKESWRQIGSVEAEEESFEDESIEADGTYFYRVRNANEKGYSNEASISIKIKQEEENEPETQPAPNKSQNSQPNSAQDWKQPKYRFEVEIPDLQIKMLFEEVSGLDLESPPIEYKDGNSPTFSVQKMPGIKKYSDITLKKGIFKGDNKIFTEWTSQAKRLVIISLLDEEGNPTMVWALSNAFPSKVTGAGHESIVISHEGLTKNQ